MALALLFITATSVMASDSAVEEFQITAPMQLLSELRNGTTRETYKGRLHSYKGRLHSGHGRNLLSRAVRADGSMPTLRFVRSLQTASLSAPVYALMLPNGQLLVSDMEANTVWQVALDGSEHGRLGSTGTFGQPTGLARGSSNDDVYVGQQNARGLSRVGLDGIVRATIGQRESDYGANATTMFVESALGVACGGGRVYVADVTGYRVIGFDEALRARRFLIDQSSLPSSLTSSLGCTPRTAGGRYQGPSCFNPHGLAFSAARGGRLWVSDPDNGALFLFDTTRDGAFVRAVKDASLFTAPRGITLLPPAPSAGFRGALVVAEARRVVMLSLTGQRLFHALRLVGAVNLLGLSVNSARREVYAADPAAKAVFVIAYDEVALNALHLRHEQGSVEDEGRGVEL
jgi:hypothetical protein